MARAAACGADMRVVLAIVLPWVVFFMLHRPLEAIVCAMLQLMLVGWIPATLWALYALFRQRAGHAGTTLGS